MITVHVFEGSKVEIHGNGVLYYVVIESIVITVWATSAVRIIF